MKLTSCFMRRLWLFARRLSTFHRNLPPSHHFHRQRFPSLSSTLGYGRQMVVDDSDGHNVEDAAGVSVLGVRELFVTPAVVVGSLNLAVDLPAISAVQIDTIFPVCSDGIVDDGISHFFLCDLLDVKSFLVANVEIGANLGGKQDFREHLRTGRGASRNQRDCDHCQKSCDRITKSQLQGDGSYAGCRA